MIHWPSSLVVDGVVWYRGRERTDFSGEEIRYRLADKSAMVVRFIGRVELDALSPEEQQRLARLHTDSMRAEIAEWQRR